MSLRSWLPEGSLKPLGGLAASSVIAGVAFGLYMQLPDYLSEPAPKGEMAYINLEDPGRAEWREVVASLGGLAATFVIPASYTEPTPAPVFAAEVDRRFDGLVDEVEAEVQAVTRQVSWDRDDAWRRREEAALEEREWRQRAQDQAYAYDRYDSGERRERPRVMAYGYDRPPYAEAPVLYGRRYEAPVYVESDPEPIPPPPPRPSNW